MKNYLLLLVALAAIVFLGLKLYKSELNPESALTTNLYEYPVDLELTNREGQALSVTLLARDSTHIQFKSKRTDTEFTYRIDQLNRASQKTVQLYPESSLQAVAQSGKSGLPKSTGDYYIEGIQNEIQKIDAKSQALEAQYNASKSKTERRTLKNELADLAVERAELEKDLQSQQ